MAEREDWLLWLKRADSNIRLAKLGEGKGVAYEDLCFEAQQAAEKALKALLIYHGDHFPKVHSFAVLLERLEKWLRIPKEIQRVLDLSDYAVQTRYPGDYFPVKKVEYKKAVKISENVVGWAQKVVQRSEGYYERVDK